MGHISTLTTVTSVLCYWCHLLVAVSADDARKERTQAPGLTLALGARIIGAPWEANGPALVDDYAEATYGRPWDFEDGTTSRIAEFGSGIIAPLVLDGKLSFTTGTHEARFFWGDADGRSSRHRQEKLRWNHPYWSIGVLSLRIRQSLPESHWRASWGGWTELGTFDTQASQQFALVGTEWQTIRVRMGRRGERFHTWLSIETGTPGNRVEIDEVRVERESEHAYFRTCVTLPAPPFFGGIWYVAQPQYTLYINGQTVRSWDGNGSGWWPAWMDITKYLKGGRNSIAFDRELMDWMGRQNFLIVGGVVRCADGHIVRIRTSEQWRVGKTPSRGWTQPDFDDSNWVNARSWGDASEAHFPPGASDIELVWRMCMQAGYQVIPPRHLGAMEFAFPGRPDPLFDAREPVVININAPRRVFDGRRYAVSYRIFDSETRHLIGSGQVPELKPANGMQRWQFRRRGLAPGVYAAYFDLTLDGKREETAFLEIAICAPIGGEKIKGTSIEEGLQLAQEDSINCGDWSDAHERIYGEGLAPDPTLPQPRIVSDPVGGQVLELDRPFQWAGYRVRFSDTTKPYLIRVTYPDTHPQIFGLRIDQPGWGSSYECVTACGAYTCRETPPSNAMRSFSTLTWPRTHEATLCLVNYNSRLPVRLKSIGIFRIDNELPQMEIPNPSPGADGSEAFPRMFGYVTERGTVVLPTFLQDRSATWLWHAMENCPTTGTLHYWWKAGQNLIRWLKFTGQNAWAYNAHMYGQTYYPTELADRYEKSSYVYTMPLLAKMFEMNDLYLFASTEFLTARPVWKQDIYTDQEVAEGADTMKAVSSDGYQQVHFAGAGANYQHPVVEDAIVTMVHDLCAPMKAYPAFKGVLLSGGGYYGPSGVFKLHRQMDFFNNSFDDTSIRRFETFSGMKVPEFGTTRDKFARRREWIERNARSQWIAWRCAAVTDVIQRCAAAASGVRKDLLVVCNWGDWSYGKARIKYWTDGVPYETISREAGVDYQALRQVPGALFGLVLEQAGEWEHASDQVIEGGFDAAMQSMEIRGGVGAESLFLHHPFSESGLQTARSGTWPWTSVPACTYSPRPVGADYLANYSRTISAGVPRMLWHGYCDVQHYSGGEQDIRTVARLFRSIPPGRFGEPAPALRTRNVLIRVHTDGKSFLLINPAWWETRCHLSLTSPAGAAPALTRLDDGAKLLGPWIEVKLDPFATETFELAPETELVAALGEVTDPRAADAMRRAVERLEALRDDLERRGVSLDGGPGSDLTKVIEGIRGYVAEADYGRAYYATKDIEYLRAVSWALDQSGAH